ncbi:MAG: GTPase HflX [Oscillospiraceae bacterium]|jgi:GTP-binding protein HflX|nr:GTPase HflX [Oscillospiraceae bacterium]
MEMHENKQSPELALLVSVDTGDYDAERSLAELEELAKTAGAEVFGKLIQKRQKPDNATFVGSGTLEQIKDICEKNALDLLIFDNELSPSQIRNIEKATDTRVVDRTMLILDIFALRANTSEGKLQVELAQLQYMLTHLTGKGVEMSRLGAGIGTRGPGESKLESDRRHIRRRIQALKEDLKALQKRRDIHRKQRAKRGVTIVAIVGYTNTGKSTLLNTLTGAGVLAQNQLFATLDPTARALKLPNGGEVMLVDTVGFVSRLPHMLVEAFKSTLEEAAFADIILNICDASSPEFEDQLRITKEILQELGAAEKTIIDVFNKCDLAEALFDLPEHRDSVKISALKGIGIDALLEKIEEHLPAAKKRVRLLLPFSLGWVVAGIRKDGVLIREEFTDDGILIEAIVDIVFLNTIQQYIISEN